MDKLTQLTAVRSACGLFSVAYDGRILGDDRSYPTLEACKAEIDRRIAVDARDAVRYDRPVMYTKA